MGAPWQLLSTWARLVGRTTPASRNIYEMVIHPLTEEKAIASIRSFFRHNPFVFIGTGMSCAVDSRFGMGALSEKIKNKVSSSGRKEIYIKEWRLVLTALENGRDLENALNFVSDPELLNEIITITGEFIAEIDRKYAYDIANDLVRWPAIGVIKKIYDALPESTPALHILTPNYDMLFEYMCEREGILYTNGFIGGITKTVNWEAISLAILQKKMVVNGKRVRETYSPKKHCILYKVHGSLNYFFHHDVIIENNSWSWFPPEFAERVLITPGLAKYQSLQRYRQELIQKPDIAIENASSFLFLGYGFNDSHLEEYIKRKLVNQSSPGLIVTRDSNSRIENIVNNSSNVWLVCKPEGKQRGTRIHNSQFTSDLIIEEHDIWDVRNFAARIFGD